jgi:hypothetical protein
MNGESSVAAAAAPKVTKTRYGARGMRTRAAFCLGEEALIQILPKLRSFRFSEKLRIIRFK